MEEILLLVWEVERKGVPDRGNSMLTGSETRGKLGSESCSFLLDILCKVMSNETREVNSTKPFVAL